MGAHINERRHVWPAKRPPRTSTGLVKTLPDPGQRLGRALELVLAEAAAKFAKWPELLP